MVLVHAKSEDKAFWSILRSAMRRLPDEFVGIRTRNIANAMFYAYKLEQNAVRDRHAVLPSVARFALGEKETPYVRRKVPARSRAPRGTNTTRRLPLVLLDDLLTCKAG